MGSFSAMGQTDIKPFGRRISVIDRVSLYQTPVPSSRFSSEALLCGDTIQFEYKRDELKIKTGLKFKSVKATRTRAESACTVWHIEGAYDTLIRIDESLWVKEVKLETADTRLRLGQDWVMNHYMIYLDSVGCFEFIAESWMILNED